MLASAINREGRFIVSLAVFRGFELSLFIGCSPDYFETFRIFAEQGQ